MGATIASSLAAQPRADLLQTQDESLWRVVASSAEGRYDAPAGAERFAVSPVEGTPWRLVISTPEAVLLAPVWGVGRLVQRLIFAALCFTLVLVILLFRALTKSRRRQLAVAERLSLTDSLTGLYNRRGMDLLATQALRSAARDGKAFVVMFMDLDHLKQFNDELGHDAGDRMLVNVSDILKRTFRDSDIIARLGGDEFCVAGATPAVVADGQLLSRLQENLARQNATSEGDPPLALSVGVSWVDPSNPRPLDELIGEADERMYEENRSRRLQQVH
jgi:diguanylate cyclase (GGDEF)-like protein